MEQITIGFSGIKTTACHRQYRNSMSGDTVITKEPGRSVTLDEEVTRIHF